MSTGSPKRKRADRVASVSRPKNVIERVTALLQRSDVLGRIALCLFAAAIMWLVTGAWAPPFAFRTGYIPPRNIVARVEFSLPDKSESEDLVRQTRSEIICLYENRTQPLIELEQALKDEVFLIIGAASYEELDEKGKEVWREFLPDHLKAEMADETVVFDDFRSALMNDPQLVEFEKTVKAAFADFEQHGLLVDLTHDQADGSHLFVNVHPVGEEQLARRVEVKDVRIAIVGDRFEKRLRDELRAGNIPEQHVDLFAKLVNNWTIPRLPTTLTLNAAASRRVSDEAVANLKPVEKPYYRGDSLANGGIPISREKLELLHDEHRALVGNMTVWQIVTRSLADIGMFVALYVLCGVYIFFHMKPLILDWRQLTTVLGLVILTVVICRVTARNEWRAEIVPLIVYGMIVTIAYNRELALVLSASVGLAVALSLGQGLPEFVILMSGISAAVLLMDRIRSRTKLLYVGSLAGVVASLTTVGVGTVVGQPLGIVNIDAAALSVDGLLASATWNGFCAVLAGILMTGLLPFVERIFDVQTDLSLLELGDAAHPLLQELARRAAGTYNHSINVASISEAAAESIGANGLLCRVGAYFHDIGKMLKPNYFIENQEGGQNQHESLLPAMSTLVIIAHVKDGADLARQHHLPQSIINFIEQHHGTTLVEYFYRQAAKQIENDPDNDEVDESRFRYPGPRPQTKEAAVMMLADASESASRTLVEPTPSRIENLVHEISISRLMDGQFDECGLTLQEVATVEDSLVKSLTAVYHARVKYPGQQTA